MSLVRPRMTHLFEQLGLEATEQSIITFIQQHQLDQEVTLLDAPFWSEGQKQFLAEKIASDGEWAIVIDQLNEALHQAASTNS